MQHIRKIVARLCLTHAGTDDKPIEHGEIPLPEALIALYVRINVVTVFDKVLLKDDEQNLFGAVCHYRPKPSM